MLGTGEEGPLTTNLGHANRNRTNDTTNPEKIAAKDALRRRVVLHLLP